MNLFTRFGYLSVLEWRFEQKVLNRILLSFNLRQNRERERAKSAFKIKHELKLDAN